MALARRTWRCLTKMCQWVSMVWLESQWCIRGRWSRTWLSAKPHPQPMRRRGRFYAPMGSVASLRAAAQARAVFFLPCGYRAPPLHADHGFRGAAPAVAALQVPTAEPHYAHRQAISLHELRARMADAITDWLGGRALHMHFGAIFFSVARLRAFLGAVKGTFRL